MQEVEYYKRDLVTSPQTLTASLVDLGSDQNTRNFKVATLFLDLDINDSEDVAVKPVSLFNDDEYSFPLKSGGTSVILVDKLEYQINVDADQKLAISMDVTAVKDLKFQVYAGTLGATAGIINSAYVVFS